MVEIPDGLAELGMVILAGVIGYLAKGYTDLRARLAVAESRLDRHADDVRRICSKIDEFGAKLTDIQVNVAKTVNSSRGIG